MYLDTGQSPIYMYTVYIYIYIYIYIYSLSLSLYIYIYIYIAAVVRMMQKVFPCDRIISLIVSKTDYLQALGGVLNPHVATPTHKLQNTVGINPHSDCFYCLSTRFSCYASFNCDSFILSVKCANPKLSNLCSCPQILFPASSGMRLLAICNTVNTTQAINTHLCTMQFPHFYTPYIITVLMHSAAATLTSHKTSGMTV